jgi:hypothetical protein
VNEAERTAWAVRVVARRVVAAAVGGTPVEWRNYPDVGEDDWKAVMAVADRIAAQHDPQGEHYDSAYRLLTQRAEGVEA